MRAHNRAVNTLERELIIYTLNPRTNELSYLWLLRKLSAVCLNFTSYQIAASVDPTSAEADTC